ncbi:MAG: glycerophosphodiester phosphodiesterase family protein [Armatimonadota bacterium]|nr:glycerophosphodiester phosphodiesterase family protein [Armatimonadota bacterium]
MSEGFRDALKSRRVLIVAHRGASAYAPENTLAAFAKACELGADVLELDVHLTRDEQVVVMHDERVDRTTDGRGEIRGMTLEEVRSLDAGGWFGPEWAGERVPTLQEVLERFAPRALVDVELKAGVAADWLRGAVREDAEASIHLARRVLEVVEQAGAVHRVVLSTFGMHALAWIRKTAPGVTTQWSVLSGDLTQDAEAAAAAGFDVLSPQEYAATADNVARAHAHGLAVHIFTRGDEEAMARLVALGVDAVKTPRPDRLRVVLARRGRMPGGRDRWRSARW